MIKCVEFFSGLGGLHYAIQETGVEYEMLVAYDINKFANAVYKHNFGLVPVSVNLEHLSVGHFEKLKADCWLLSPPCQPYTRGGKMLDDKDARAVALLHLIRVLDEMKNPPQFIFLENVLNFETSCSRNLLVSVLAKRGYKIEEYLATPNDLWIAIPNDRLRYYLAAKRVQEDDYPIGEQKIITDLSEVLGVPPNQRIRQIQEFLRLDEGEDPCFKVPEKYLTDYKNYKHDIANPTLTRSTTFTKAYGSNYIIGTGSFLQTKRLDLAFGPDDKPTLLTLGLRFFTPMEIALLHALPVADSAEATLSKKYHFSFPSSITIPQQYRLLGNSLNVRVVSLILGHLLSTN